MLVVLGDSHATALKAGLAELDAETRQFLGSRFGDIRVGMLQTGPFFTRGFFRAAEDGLWLLGEGAEAALQRVAGFGNPLRPAPSVTYGFYFGMHVAILLRKPIWKTFTIDPSCDARQFVSDAVFRAVVRLAQQHVLAFFEQAKSLGFRFFVIAPPPLRKEFLAAHGSKAGSAAILAMAARFRETMTESLAPLEIPFLLPPPGVSEGGLLKPALASFRPDDEHHGNSRYGTLVWRHLAHSLDQLLGDPGADPRTLSEMQATSRVGERSSPDERLSPS